MALDNLLVHDRQGRAYGDKRRRQRLSRELLAAVGSEELPPLPPGGAVAAFRIAPSVTVAEGASRRFTVVEVQAADRPGLLAALALAIHRAGFAIHSAHIATYGERGVDVFYLANSDGRKLTATEIAALRPALLRAAAEPEPRASSAA
jgi:[protein-PII] uridylyltransferase